MADGMRIKKWFMLQVWRFQQISQVATLVMLSASLATTVWSLVKYRGGIFANSFVGILVIMIIIGFTLWAFAIYWDLRLRMWRDQATVLVERNPYSKEKMAPKEIVLYAMTWLPVMEKLGENDPKMRAEAEAFRGWLRKASREEPGLERDMKEILEFIGEDARALHLQKDHKD